ncbi:hypothetical protein NE237_027956 [Protea cynaroides]|uniref:Uncharacterized protein n=1 Tax=Protea cynaroides TaxID=273540 RepID=A0A9Q0JSE9_9MAGN|nr:hypothetical protein NE237_027956 [Protea cynaroides]
MFEKKRGWANLQPKLPLSEIKWEYHKVHDKIILILVGTIASCGSADGNTMKASCSEGTDIILWHGQSGAKWKILVNLDTSQLKYNMATISPNRCFIAAAAFTADVKSAVTWLCFATNSEQVITDYKDCSIRIWNINGNTKVGNETKLQACNPCFPSQKSNGNATKSNDKGPS